MLTFIDESGIPHPNDASTRPVVAAICFDEGDSRTISRRLYAMKRDLLGSARADAELKGKKLLKEKTYLNSSASRMFAEDFFAALRDWGVNVFATIMQAPFSPHPEPGGLLETRFRYLLQRIELLAAERDTYASVLFDGRGSQFRDLSRRFSGYLYRSYRGQVCTHITDTPAFVDSVTSAGIQMADMCAYAIRVYYEHSLFASRPSSDDEYQRAVRSWYRYVERLTLDLSDGDGEIRYGLYRMRVGAR